MISVVVLAAAAATVSTPWWGPRLLARLDYFHVRTIEIEGLRYAKPSELMQRLHVDTMQSVWQPLDSLVARIADHPMVLRATIDRDLPGTLRVLVSERVPVALVSVRGGLRPADATGAVLPIDPAAAPLDMPLAASADSALLSALDGLRQNAPELYARVTEARRVNKDELRFVLNAGEYGAAGPAMMHAVIVRTTPDVTVARFRDILPVEADLAMCGSMRRWIRMAIGHSSNVSSLTKCRTRKKRR
jgi:cell division protein FtsQ